MNQGGFVMKLIKKELLVTVVLLCFVVLAIGFIGCSKDSPLAPENNLNQTVDVNKQIKLIPWNTSSSSFKKILSASEWITKADGGTLNIQFNDRLSNSIRGEVSLTIDPGAIDWDKNVELSMDDVNLDFYFGPSGTQFAPEARFNLWMSGLDFTNIDPASINLFYFDPMSGNWEAVPNEGVQVNPRHGYIKITNARLPHFSRYAVGEDD
jgi:hypothetical protein